MLTGASGFDPASVVEFDDSGRGYGDASSLPAMADYQGTGKADFAVFTPDGKGGMQYVYQASQVGQGVELDFALTTDIPLTAPLSAIIGKVRGS